MLILTPVVALVKIGIMYISVKFSNKDLKRNVLGNVKVLCTQVLNICPKKCNLYQIPICCQEMCSLAFQAGTAKNVSLSLS